MLCEVDRSYIEDSCEYDISIRFLNTLTGRSCRWREELTGCGLLLAVNLYGLRPYVANFKECLDLILDRNQNGEQEINVVPCVIPCTGTLGVRCNHEGVLNEILILRRAAFAVLMNMPMTESDTSGEELQQNAEILYGMIHARYIITIHGLETMVSVYMQMMALQIAASGIQETF